MPKRPAVTLSRTTRMETGCGSIYVTVGRCPKTGEIVEVFTPGGKAGGCAALILNTVTKLLSYAIQAGVPIKKLSSELRDQCCHLPTRCRGVEVKSCIDAIGAVLQSEQKYTKLIKLILWFQEISTASESEK